MPRLPSSIGFRCENVRCEVNHVLQRKEVYSDEDSRWRCRACHGFVESVDVVAANLLRSPLKDATTNTVVGGIGGGLLGLVLGGPVGLVIGSLAGSGLGYVF